MSFITVQGNSIHYNISSGNNDNGKVFYLAGHRNDMTTPTGVFLKNFCKKNNLSLIQFDYSGWGESSGASGQEGRLYEWIEEAVSVFDSTVSTDEKVILVGFSMGGLLALALAELRPHNIKAIFGISSGFGVGCYRKFVNHYDTEYLKLPNGKRFDLEETESGVVLKQKLSFEFPLKFVHYVKDPWVSLSSIKVNISNIMADVSLKIIEEEGRSPKTEKQFKPFSDELLNLI